jgi:hypothetical protein
MKIGVKLRPSKTKHEHDPGHMAVYWGEPEERKYRGFRFYVEDLPKEYRDPSRWREYLFAHQVAGHIFDDILILDDLKHQAEKVLCKQWPAGSDHLEEMTRLSPPGPHGHYSFNPKADEGCHNCVTWAISTVRSVLGDDAMPMVPSGRVKLALETLKNLGAAASA